MSQGSGKDDIKDGNTAVRFQDSLQIDISFPEKFLLTLQDPAQMFLSLVHPGGNWTYGNHTPLTPHPEIFMKVFILNSSSMFTHLSLPLVLELLKSHNSPLYSQCLATWSAHIKCSKNEELMNEGMNIWTNDNSSPGRSWLLLSVFTRAERDLRRGWPSLATETKEKLHMWIHVK